MRNGRRSELMGLARVAGPLVLAQLAQNGMSFIDTVMVGRLGALPLAGLALGAVAFSFVFLMGMALVMSVTPLVAQAVGADRGDEAASTLRHGLLLALSLALPLALVVANLTPLLRSLGQDEAVLAETTRYLRTIALGLPGGLAFVALRGFLEGHGLTRPVMFVALTGVALNAGLNEVLIFGRLGLPELGVAGAGVASSITYTLMSLALVAIVSRGFRPLRVFRNWGFQWPLARELLAVGWPISLTLGFEVGLFSAAAIVMGIFGEAALAGHQIAMQTASFTFMVPLGVGIATGVRVGQATGRGDREGARRAGWTGVAVAAAVMVVTSVVYVTLPRVVTSIYLDVDDPTNAGVVAYASTFLLMAGIFQVFDGVQVAAVGALRGLKDTRVPMYLTLFSYWLVGFPLGLACAFWLGMGPRGMWIGLVVALAVAAVLLSARFRAKTRPREAAPAAIGA